MGEVMIELIAAPTTAKLSVAGDSYNTAVYLKRLLNKGETVSYITALGDDGFSTRITADMARHEIDASYVEIRAGTMPGLYAIETDAAGERAFSYWRDSAAVRSLFQPPCQVELPCLLDFDLLFLTGISIAVLPSDTRKALLAQIDAFRANGGFVAFDSNYRPRLWADERTARAVTAEFWARADICLPSLDDEMALFGQDETAVYARFGAEATAGVSAGVSARVGAMKRGGLGPRGLSGIASGAVFAPAPVVVDTTAAGDSFNAGFLSVIINGGSIDEAMMAGHNLAMQVVQKAGAILVVNGEL